jgi:hypothetical protein
MKRFFQLEVLLVILSLVSYKIIKAPEIDTEKFPDKMVHFVPYKNNPVFTGTNTNTWDKKIRERGYVLFENGIYKMWYTGYNDEKIDTRFLGYAVF